MAHFTTLVRSNGQQTIRLPTEAAFPEDVREVAITKDDARRVIVPANAVWDDFFDEPGIGLLDRQQPQG